MRLSQSSDFVRIAITGFVDHKDLTWSASIAYYTTLSIAPLLVLALWAASLIDPATREQLIAQIGLLAGGFASDALRVVVQSASRRPVTGGIAGAMGIGVLLFGATSVFAQLQSSLNVILSDAKPRAASNNFLWAWLRRRLLSIGILAAIAFILIVSLIVSALLTLLPKGDGAVWTVINNLVGFGVFWCLFAAIFKFLPDARLPWRHTWGGAFVTAVLFTAGKFLIGIYLTRSGIGNAYGPAGALVLMLVWVFYSSAIFLFGAELVQADIVVRAGQRDVSTH